MVTFLHRMRWKKKVAVVKSDRDFSRWNLVPRLKLLSHAALRSDNKSISSQHGHEKTWGSGSCLNLSLFKNSLFIPHYAKTANIRGNEHLNVLPFPPLKLDLFM